MVKSVTTFLLFALFELFAVQQIATGMRTVTIQWTLSLAYSGIIMLLPSFTYFIFSFVKKIPVVINHSDTQEDAQQ
jgi:hypothetical protein